MEAYLKSFDLGKPKNLLGFKKTKAFRLVGFSAFSLLGLKQLYEMRKDKKLVLLKKERLAMPVYELSAAELENPPWAEDYEAWRFRRVRFQGRPIFRHSMYIPKRVHNYEGYDWVVPVVTKEDENLDNRSGLLVNRGWLPGEYKNPDERLHYEDSFSQFEYVGVVNRGEDLDRRVFFKKGNAFDEQRFDFNNLSFRDMGKATGFLNSKGVKAGLVELVDMETTKIDETDPHFYDRDMSGTKSYPYKRTYSGIL